MTKIRWEEAVKNIKSLARGYSSSGIQSSTPFVREAVARIGNSNVPVYFQKRIQQIVGSRKTTKSTTISALLDRCINETKSARLQYRNGQLRSLILHLHNDIKICQALDADLKAFLGPPSNEGLEMQIDNMRTTHKWVVGYLGRGSISSEEAIVFHLDLTEWLLKNVLDPSHRQQHVMTAIEFAKVTAGFLPGFCLFDYAVAINKINPSERIRLDLLSGDKSVRYWEKYLHEILEWEKASFAFQLRVEDALLSMIQARPNK